MWLRMILAVLAAFTLAYTMAPTQALAAPDTPQISGTVYAGATPVSGAYVCAVRVGDAYGYHCASTSPTGGYSIGLDLDVGASYIVQASQPAFLTTYYGADGSVAARQAATAVAFGDGPNQSGKDIHLITGATVSGTVSRASTGPVAGAYVCDDSGQYNCDSTEPDGTFSLKVAPGTTKLRATSQGSHADNYFVFSGEVSLSVTDGVSYPDTNIVLSEGTGLGGTVTRDLPVGVDVSVYRVVNSRETFVDDRWMYGDETAFAFRHLAPGSYVVRFSAEGFADACFGGDTCTPVVVTDGKVATVASTSLTRLAPGSVTGTVVDSAGNPLSGVVVKANYNDATSSQTTTDASGAYSFDPLPSGLEWHLSFTKAGLTADTRYATAKPGQNTVVPPVHMLGTGTVSGTITVPSGGDPKAVAVYLNGPAYYTATPDAEGHYSFSGVVPGRYHLRAYRSVANILSAWYPGVQSSDDAPRIVVGEGKTVGLDPLVLGAPASISGSLLDADGKPVQGYVDLYDASDSEVDSEWVSSSGQFTFTDLWPGQYTIRASADTAAFKNTWLGNTTSIDTADRITLSKGEDSTGNDITMVAKAGGPVTGRVVSHDGTTGVAGIDVYADGVSARTGEDGSFTMAFVPKGSYPVALYSSGVELCGPGRALTCDSLVVGDDGASGVIFTLPEFGSVTGQISGPGGVAVSDAELYLLDANDYEVAWGQLSSGTFTFAKVPFGTYTLVADADGLARYSTSVTVDGAETHDITLSAQRMISGTVTIESSAQWMSVDLIDATTGRLFNDDYSEDVDAGAVPFTFANVEDGHQYWIRVTADHGREVWYSETDPDADTPLVATKVAANGADLSGINLALGTPAGWPTVSGTLALPTGITPDAAFEICFGGDDGDDHYCTNSASDGTYTLNLPAGSYYAWVEERDDLGIVSAEKTVDVTGDTTVDFQMLRGGSLSGRLVDANGVGVEGEVRFRAEGFYESGVTDSFGYWTIDSVPAGQVTFTAAADGFADYTGATPVTVAAGQDNALGDQVLTAAGSLRIDLADVAGVDETKVNVIVTDSDGTKELARETIWTGDDDTITGLPAGPVKVRFEGAKVATEWWRNAPDADRAAALTIANDTTTAIFASLAAADSVPPATVSGLITNNSGRSGTLRMTAFDQDDQKTVAEVAADGSYSLPLPPGTYQFRASVCDGLWMGDSGCLGKAITAWYHGTSTDNAERVTVTSGEASTVDVTIGGPLGTFTVGTPTITGTAKVGHTLTASAGTWTPASGVTYTYRWFRGGETLGTGATYTLQSSDQGKTVSVKVTAKKAGYTDATSDPVTSGTVDTGTLDTAKPSIDGTSAVGATLTAKPGNWTDGTTFTYQWKRDDVAIGGASGATYQATEADAGRTISVSVTGAHVGYESASRTSDAVTIQKLKVGAGSVSLQASSWNVGVAVNAVPSGWPAGASLSYQWKRNGAPIAGATGQTYTLVAADQGAAISVAVTGAITGQDSVSVESSPSGTVQAPLKKLTKGKVSVSGTAKVGKKLSVKVSKWKPSGIKYRYQWLRNGVEIAGATKSSYKIAKSDKKSKISVRVIATKAGYASITVTSKTTAKVK